MTTIKEAQERGGWREDFNQKFARAKTSGGFLSNELPRVDDYYPERERIKSFISTLIEQTIKEERERVVEEMHRIFPVPNMQHAELWPHDEQVRWAGIGEVMVKLQALNQDQ